MEEITVKHSNAVPTAEPADIQYIPFKIHYTGPALVEKYFVPKEVKETTSKEPVYDCMFRGRELFGKDEQLPDGLEGVVLHRTSADGEDRVTMETVKTFKTYRRWRREEEPSNDDLIPRCLQWFSLAKAIHAPVTAAEMEAVSGQTKAKGTPVKRSSRSSTPTKRTPTKRTPTKRRSEASVGTTPTIVNIVDDDDDDVVVVVAGSPKGWTSPRKRVKK